MITEPLPTDDDELLTAYLDGELDDPQRVAFQRRLVDEPKLRKRLHELQSTWDLLDELPETPINQEFTKSTLEMVVAKAHVTSEAIDSPGRRLLSKSNRPSILVGLLVGSLLVGLIAGFAFRWRTQRLERRELSALTILPGLRIIDSIDTARAFADMEDVTLAAEEIEELRKSMIQGLPARLDQRPAWLDALESNQKAMLWSRKQEFMRIPPDESKQMLQTANHLEWAPDAENLVKAVSLLGALFERQTDEERQSLQLLSPKDRNQRITYLLYKYLSFWYKDHLSEDDGNQLSQFFRDKVYPRSNFRNGFPRLMIYNYFLPDVAGVTKDMTRGQLESEIDELTQQLSPFAQRCLHHLNQDDQRMFVFEWMSAATFPEGLKNPTDEELLESLNDWDATKRDKAEMTEYSSKKDELERDTILRRRTRGLRSGGAARNRQLDPNGRATPPERPKR